MPISITQLLSEAVLLVRSRRSFIPALVVILTASAFVLINEASADAGVPTCLGIDATHWDKDGDNIINGSSGSDVIVGTDQDDVISGGDGDDLICGKGGADTIKGNKGKDIIYGNAGSDDIHGGKGADRLFGGSGNDSLDGGNGNDRLRGKSGNDNAHGQMGADVCIAESETSCEMDRRWGFEPEDWRPLVDLYFGDIEGATDIAICIIDLESKGGQPFIVGGTNDNYYGLFQHALNYWPRRAENAGTPVHAAGYFEGESPFHPEANIAAARWISDWRVSVGQDRWADWSVAKSCT